MAANNFIYADILLIYADILLKVTATSAKNYIIKKHATNWLIAAIINPL